MTAKKIVDKVYDADLSSVDDSILAELLQAPTPWTHKALFNAPAKKRAEAEAALAAKAAAAASAEFDLLNARSPGTGRSGSRRSRNGSARTHSVAGGDGAGGGNGKRMSITSSGSGSGIGSPGSPKTPGMTGGDSSKRRVSLAPEPMSPTSGGEVNGGGGGGNGWTTARSGTGSYFSGTSSNDQPLSPGTAHSPVTGIRLLLVH
jgi:hypothetical protein